MEQPVTEIFAPFCRDLTEDYLTKQTGSFLYKAFWCENMRALLNTHFPALSAQELPAPDDAEGLRRLRGQMILAMRERPEWAGGLLLRSPGGKLRRDFWEELWLNDIGCRAKLITDTEYYLWLVRYLTAHGIYYKTNIYYYGEGKNREVHYGHTWLYRLLMVGLQMNRGVLKREVAARKKARKEARKNPGAEERLPGEAAKDRFSGEKAEACLSQADLDELDFSPKTDLSKTEVAEALAMLAEQIRAGRDRIAGRLHHLPCRVRGEDGKWVRRDYLSWLTEQLEWMALHIRIKNWLQDGGYPLKAAENEEPPKVRRDDFTMRLFEAYCACPEGYEVKKKQRGPDGEAHGAQSGPGGKEGSALSGNWRLEREGTPFCVLHANEEHLSKLLTLHAKEQDESPYLYLPLAVHLQSGCVFFLAGKEYYEEVYRKAESDLQKAYSETSARYCFDYLRQEDSGCDRAGSFRLSPSFLEHALSDQDSPDHVKACYQEALAEFKIYCESPGRGSPLHAIRKFNGPEPEDAPQGPGPKNIPRIFRWAFDG